jgi:anti-sigma regulatory factor (Ser/Thr protein kinase)
VWEDTFAAEAGAVRRSRVLLQQALAGMGVASQLIDDALLVAAELIANAIRHAQTEFTVTVRVRPGVVRLEVFDRDTRPPALLGLDSESTSGRGLHIVAGLASDWGWQTAEDDDGISGKRVWAELASGPTSDSPPTSTTTD